MCQLGQNDSMIRIIHPDTLVRQALTASFAAIWPDAPCVFSAADEAKTDDNLLILNTPPQRLSALVAKIQQLQRQDQWPALVTFGPTEHCAQLNTRTREWVLDGETTLLTEKEVGVLLYLWQKKLPVTREDLLRDIWQYAANADTHTIETHIYRLRQKIETDPTAPEFLITTKDGYQLAANSNA